MYGEPMTLNMTRQETGKSRSHNLCYILEYTLSPAVYRENWTNHVDASNVLLYRAKNTGLGTLEKLPAELRSMIFELVLDIDHTITTRTCCGPLSEKSSYCGFHNTLIYRGQIHNRTRFALIYVSREVNQATMWIMHNKMKICAGVTTLMLIMKKELGLYPHGPPDIHHMRYISRFRQLELTLPSLTIPSTCNQYIHSLMDVLRQLAENWQIQNSAESEKRTRNVVVHVGAVFAKHPSKDRWKHLEEIVELMAMNEDDVKWTITAVSNISSKTEGAQYHLDVFKALLELFRIEFQETTAVDVPVLSAVESRGVMGGRHRRFLD